MKRGARLTRIATVLAPCLLTTGCLVPYAYPKLSYVPGGRLGPQAADVHAFRVEAGAKQVDMGENGTVTITPIELETDGRLPAQTRLSVEHGKYVVGVTLNYNAGWVHTVRVRLYRPGYQLVELPAWSPIESVHWEPATDWAAQERAIDDLLRQPVITSNITASAKDRGSFWGAGNRPRETSTNSPQVRATFRFATGEYERVAKLCPNEADVSRLREKARILAHFPPTISPGSANDAGIRPSPVSP